jgi:hypothetical protein
MSMGIDVEHQVVIRRPRAEVAAHMFEPRNDPTWNLGVIESRPLSDGPLRKGSRTERVGRFLGRRIRSTREVVDIDDGAFVELSVTGLIPMRVRYELVDVTRGTLTRIRARGRARGLLQVGERWLAHSLREDIARVEGSNGFVCVVERSWMSPFDFPLRKSRPK